jgi:hypothetical protein
VKVNLDSIRFASRLSERQDPTKNRAPAAVAVSIAFGASGRRDHGTYVESVEHAVSAG